MTRYEYKFLRIEQPLEGFVDSQLSRLGKDGWRVISVQVSFYPNDSTPKEAIYHLERPWGWEEEFKEQQLLREEYKRHLEQTRLHFPDGFENA